MSILPRMYQHMAWADKHTLQSLRDMDRPPAQAVQLFAHVVGAEHEWLCRIQGRKSTHAIWPKFDFDECDRVARENHAALSALAAEATGDAGQRLITYRNSSGAEYTNSLEDILLHLAQHGVYHRGQVALLVRAAGGKAIPTDYVVFLRESM